MTSETYRSTTATGAPASGRPLMRVALQLDALVTGANGIAYVALAGPLEDALGLSTGLLRGAGVVLIAFAAAVWLLASRSAIRPGPVAAVIAVNVVWAIDSVAALALGWVDPTTVGGIWIALQALVVAGFAGLQAYARSR